MEETILIRFVILTPHWDFDLEDKSISSNDTPAHDDASLGQVLFHNFQ